MLAKTICLLAFAAFTMAAPLNIERDPASNGDRSKQMARIKQLRAQGLVCNESQNSGGTFVCSDGFGGDWSVNFPSTLSRRRAPALRQRLLYIVSDIPRTNSGI
ncbi:hypothetical protein VTL71DRAFT_3871 [Oculimacula yallundae]|uniref:Uncharacterized protein n=1 Tax=Oculimacula yallundae TaxID=86028 RepID=A0ABR4C6N2_9HELO